MAANPMTQFEVYRIGPEIKVGTFDISFTNASLFMIISSLTILFIFYLGSKKYSILLNQLQILYEGCNQIYPETNFAKVHYFLDTPPIFHIWGPSPCDLYWK